ncbi:uncharacterized protein [Apostichopus japonicus]|uniref:uncharacterized protein n=1 Tax=Stichopus japonicus TaxID=307972 RepID=UPI003AB3821C
MEEELVKSVADELNCSICMNRFRVPKMLDCIHTFCESCLEGYVKKLNGKKLTCPMCRKTCSLPAGVKGLQTNIYLVNMCDKIDLYEKLKSSKLASKLCESCKKNTTVTAFCIDCKYAICKSCEEHRSLFPTLQSHEIERLDNFDERKLQIVQKSVMVPTCDLHVPEKLRFYCKTCSKLICRECTVIQHPKPDHMCVEASSQFVEVKEKLSNFLREILEQERVVAKYVTDAKSGESVIKMESETMLKVIQDRYQKVKSEIESQLNRELEEAQKAVKQKQASKESNIDKSLQLADNWMRRMKSTKDTTQKVIRENNMWELLSLSNNLIGSFNELQDDTNTFQWNSFDLKIDMFFSPADIPSVNLGQCFSKNYPNSVICENSGYFYKFHFNRKALTISRTKVTYKKGNPISFIEQELPPISLRIKTCGGQLRFNATISDGYSILAIQKWLLVVELGSNVCLGVFTFNDKALISCLAAYGRNLFITFGNNANTICYLANISRYLVQPRQHEQNNILDLRLLCQDLSCELTRYELPHNIKDIKALHNSDVIVSFENSIHLYNIGTKTLSEINIKTPLLRKAERLFILNVNYTSRGGFGNDTKKEDFTCFILWNIEEYTNTSGSTDAQLCITKYDSSKEQHVQTWPLSAEVGLPRACYWDQNYNTIVVCNALGKCFRLQK